MPPPKTIFFDLDETLADNQRRIQSLFIDLFEQHKNTLGEENRTAFFDFFRAGASKLWDALFLGSDSPEEKLTKLLGDSIQQLNIMPLPRAKQISEDMFQQFVNDSAKNVRFNPNAKNLLSSLRKAGYQTGIITNGIAEIQMAKINALNLAQEVDTVTVSAHAKAHKPLADVFQLALARSETAADNSWMVGDHPLNDVCGPQHLGITGVYYNPNNLNVAQTFDELDCTPSFVISDLLELLDCLTH